MDADSRREAAAIVEVAFATPQRQCIVEVVWHENLTARDAVRAASLSTRFPEWGNTTLSGAPLGVFGETLREPEHYLTQPGDRIEVYRPLEIDPKQARRERAARS